MGDVREKLKNMLIQQQLSTQNVLMNKIAQRNKVKLPPLNFDKLIKGVGGSSPQQEHQQQLPVPISKRSSSSVSSRRQPVVNLVPQNQIVPYQRQPQQWVAPSFSYRPVRKNVLPSGFTLQSPVREFEQLNLPTPREVHVVEDDAAEIDWNPPGESWWRKDSKFAICHLKIIDTKLFTRTEIAIKLRHIFYVAWYLSYLKAGLAAVILLFLKFSNPSKYYYFRKELRTLSKEKPTKLCFSKF